VKRRQFLQTCAAGALALGADAELSAQSTSAATLEDAFRNPPSTALARTWWHWMNGNISEIGITRDLEAMKRVGCSGFQIFQVGTGIAKGPVDYGSPQHFALLRHAAREAGLQIFSVTNPASPVLLSSNATVGDDSWNVALANGCAYVADGWGGLKVYSVTNPAAPVLLKNIRMGEAIGVCVAGNRVYVADDVNGLAIFCAVPMLQYMAQGACMAMEDAVCLADSLAGHQPAAKKFIAEHEKLFPLLGVLVQGKLRGVRIRCHGTFQLSETLYTGKDFFFIDFE